MKAKEYFTKHLAHLTDTSNQDDLADAVAALFNEFMTEFKERLKACRSTQTIKTGVVEFNKKWIAAFTLLDKNITNKFNPRDPTVYLTDVDAEAASRVFQEYLKEKHEKLYELLEVKAVVTAKHRTQSSSLSDEQRTNMLNLFRRLLTIC